MTDYDLSGLQVLIVDDYRPMRRILLNVLFALGINNIMEASDGTEALKCLKTFPADLIVTDNLMEPMGGVELVRRIRDGENEIDPFLPVIMISGFSDMKHIVEARDVGINEFLTKPISAKLVYYRIRSVIENPRSFIRSDGFFGPDRRRRPQGLQGEDRRGEAYDYHDTSRSKDR